MIPESSFVHTIHSGQRTQKQAQVFSNKIKQNSNGKAPYIESDGWFYAQVLSKTYSTKVEPPYGGRGRKPVPRRLVDPFLKYAQVVKERKNGKITNIFTRIVLGDELEILDILDKSERAKHISTSFVESRNGAYRKDDIRLCRKTKCHSKQIEPHDAQIEFITHIYNYTKGNEAFRELINPNAKRFEVKYKKVSPAMKEGLTKRIYSLQEMLLMKPLMFDIT